MERIFYKPEMFTTRGQKFETPNCLGGTFTIELVERTSDDKFIFLRRRKANWPEQKYTFSLEDLGRLVYVLVPGKFERIILRDEACRKYEAMLSDPKVLRVEQF